MTKGLRGKVLEFSREDICVLGVLFVNKVIEVVLFL